MRMGLIWFLVLMIILINLMSIQDALITKEQAISSLNWSNYNNNFITSDSNEPLINIVYKIVDAYGYSLFEITKIGIDWGIDNLHISVKLVLSLLIISILAPIVFVLIKLSIISFIFIKDLIDSKREKKELEILREEDMKKNV